jgi:hypothetical protein
MVREEGMHWLSKEERRKGGLGEVEGDQSQGSPRERTLGGRLGGRKDGRESWKYDGEVERSRKYRGPEGERGS